MLKFFKKNKNGSKNALYYSDRRFKGYRRDDKGAMMLSFSNMAEMSIAGIRQHIKQQQEFSRNLLRDSQENVEGLDLRPNEHTERERREWANHVFALQRDRDYIGKIEYLINYGVLHERTSCKLTSKQIEKLYENPKARPRGVPDIGRISLLSLLKGLTLKQWIMIIGFVSSVFMAGYWVHKYLGTFVGD